MHILKTELFQLLTLGFAIGSLLSVAVAGPDVWTAIVPDVIAAAL